MEEQLKDASRGKIAIRTMRWWDSEGRFNLALAWWADNQSRAARIPVSQWEALVRQGQRGTDSIVLRKELMSFFRGGSDSTRRGAVSRDSAKAGWAQPGIADSLLDAIGAAARPDDSELFREYQRCLSSTGTESQAASELDGWRQVCQIREFLAALLLKARCEGQSRRLKNKAKDARKEG